MKVKWNNCFLCLNDLSVGTLDEGPSVKKRKKARKQNSNNGANCKSIRANSVLLLNYLLDAKSKKYSAIIDNILEFIASKEKNKAEQVVSCNDVATVKFCDKCETHLKAVGELHRQLEVVQMKLVHVLKTVQSIVIRNSRNSNGDKNKLEIFENLLKDQEQKHVGKEVLFIEQRKITNALYSFHTGVLENAKNSIEIPRIFLDNFTHHPTVENSNSMGSPTVLVKTEAVDQNEILNFNMPSPEDPDWFAENDYDELPKPINAERKTRKRKTVSSSANVKIKKEHASDCDDIKKDKGRIKKSVDRKQKTRKPKHKTKSTLADVKVKNGECDIFVPRRKARSSRYVAGVPIPSETGKTEKTNYSLMKKEKIETPNKKRARILQPFRLMPHSEKQKYYKPGQYWACATCPFASTNIYRFQYHLRTHEVIVGEGDTPVSSTRQFRCEKCADVTFSVEQHYQFHEACHLGAISMPCDICNESCEPMTMGEHLKTHVEKTFPCPNCYYCCSTRENYLHHLKLHLNSDIHECDICRQICTSRKLLIDHYHTDHQALEMQVCNVDGCTKEFLDPIALAAHKNNFHTNSFVCQHCGKSLCSASSLETHLASQHTGEKRFACQHCSETFSFKESLNRHMVRQHAAPKVKCEYCEKEYVEMASLKIHMAQVHTGSEFVCDYPECGKIFGNRTLLKRHSAIHSEERKFPCEECGKRFKLAQDVKKHMFVHFGEKKFKCQFCEKTFLFQKYLTQHLRIHTGEKPFVCDHCGAAFSQYASLYLHKRNCRLQN